MVTLIELPGFSMHTVGAKCGLTKGFMKPAFFELPNSASMAFLTASKFHGMELLFNYYSLTKYYTLFYRY